MDIIKRIYVEKKPGFDVEARSYLQDLKDNLRIQTLDQVRLLYRYDIQGIDASIYQTVRNTIFAEPPVDRVYDETFDAVPGAYVFAIEYLPGQYDQRADSAAQALQLISQGDPPLVKTARVFILSGSLSDEQVAKIKDYCINPVDSREAQLEKPSSLEETIEEPGPVKILKGFISSNDDAIETMRQELDLAMNGNDLRFIRDYFMNEEKRDPTLTEIKMLDTYWSDHCRHTTFLTEIDSVSIDDGPYSGLIERAYQTYLSARNEVYQKEDRPVCLMDLALMGMKELRKKGLLEDLDLSDEINACSIKVKAHIDGNPEDWLVMFKNETHNHPTEIEPFGGAATCLGGAIRDPLSGRTYVYQAMRVTGSGDPRRPVSETLPGKLPQRTITTKAAHGYSSYGNQIGIATGQVAEIYDEGYIAKRMEIGAVIGAAPERNVVRHAPEAGDIVLLVGGRTGRDGIGGATGSSKAHTEHALKNEAEVQKGNPPVERKLQRLFRNPDVTRMIKKCNDFGAGGVSVAIGELTRGLDIFLDEVPKKYEGLDGTDLALSESQERMAVVIARQDFDRFMHYVAGENLEATRVAEVKNHDRLKMFWRGDRIVDISRAFLDTNGVRQHTRVRVQAASENDNYFNTLPREIRDAGKNLKQGWLNLLGSLEVGSQRGLVERFDSTIGAMAVLHPFGGIYQETPTECMVSKLPVLEGETTTATLMSYGFNPLISKWSPFHGAVYAVLESVAKIVATGGDFRTIRLTLQEYFEKLKNEPQRWGKPFSALLGAYYIQNRLEIAAIGGKDSMSGSFNERDVPPTLVSFAVDTADVNQIISPEFKNTDSTVVLLQLPRDGEEMPDFNVLKSRYDLLGQLIRDGHVLSAQSLRHGGMAVGISKMTLGNRIGFQFDSAWKAERLFSPDYGSILIEFAPSSGIDTLLKKTEYTVIGHTIKEEAIRYGDIRLTLSEIKTALDDTLEDVFPTMTEEKEQDISIPLYRKRSTKKSSASQARPRVLIPVFPGINCEYDTARKFEQAGGIAESLIFRNLTTAEILESIDQLSKKIKESQILMLPGGFSAGDEPEGSGKFIAAVLRNPKIADAVMELLNKRDGLILGICNGFQALIKLGLVPYGEIREISSQCPTLTFNRIGRHVSRMVRTRIVSVLSPWFLQAETGDEHVIPVSHGEGRFVAEKEHLEALIRKGQVATQYVDDTGNPSMETSSNPNGSFYAIEGITSPDGRILGKMAHSERMGYGVGKNIPGNKDQRLFESGIAYFK